MTNTTKTCRHCFSVIPWQASVCSYCTRSVEREYSGPNEYKEGDFFKATLALAIIAFLWGWFDDNVISHAIGGWFLIWGILGHLSIVLGFLFFIFTFAVIFLA